MAGVCVASLGLSGCNNSGGTAAANSKGPAGGPGGRRGGGDVPVTIAKVVQKEVPVDLQVIGNIEAYSTINVKAQVSGELIKVHFHEGDFVNTGDTLFSLDRRQIEAQLAQMQATLAKNQAMLQQAQANLAKDQANAQFAKSQAARYDQLTKEGVISKDQNDQVQTSSDASRQAVEADKAMIESARADINATKANVDNLNVMVSYTTIKSPINGRTGNLNVKQGNIVTANSMDMMTINQVQPIYATFSVPEMHLSTIKAHMAQDKLKVFATPQDSTDPPEVGVLTFIDNTVDTSTGTIKLKATFPNTNRKLWPGEFVRVTVRLRTDPNALVVPNQAVQTGQSGPYVYVVKEDRSVESRDVITGARVDQQLVIAKGVSAGETVVVDGQLRLAPGMKIQVREPGARGGARGAGGAGKGGGEAPAAGGAPAATPQASGEGDKGAASPKGEGGKGDGSGRRRPKKEQ